jgi:hypothetical protein
MSPASAKWVSTRSRLGVAVRYVHPLDLEPPGPWADRKTPRNIEHQECREKEIDRQALAQPYDKPGTQVLQCSRKDQYIDQKEKASCAVIGKLSGLGAGPAP